jgi:hypothetical protein
MIYLQRAMQRIDTFKHRLQVVLHFGFVFERRFKMIAAKHFEFT